MSHPHSAIHLFQFLVNIYHSMPDEDTFNPLLISFQTPRFVPVSTLLERWTPTFQNYMPHLLGSFQEIVHYATRSPDYDELFMKVSSHFQLIYPVSCLLETDLQLELFVRCLFLGNKGVTKEEIRETMKRFVNGLPEDIKMFIQSILLNDSHGYLLPEDLQSTGSLDLDSVYSLINDQSIFDQFMAILQYNTTHQIEWNQTMAEIYDLVQPLNIWDSLSPLLEAIQPDTQQYASYEEYVQKNFLDEGGKEYLDGEIDRAQLEHMLSNLTM